MKASEIEGFGRQLAGAVGAAAPAGPSVGATDPASVVGKWVAAIAKDLQAHRGRSLVVAGDYQPAAVHTIARSINQALGNVGSTVTYGPSVEVAPTDHTASLKDLVQAMDAGQVEVLVIFGGLNPVYTAPADLKFAEKLSKVKLSVYHGLYLDETAYLCHWNVPDAHPLESWGDSRSFDGTVTLIQPLIAPLYDGRSALEVLSTFTAQPDRRGYAIVKDYWTRCVRRRPVDDPFCRWPTVQELRCVLAARAARRVHQRHRHRERWTSDTVCCTPVTRARPIPHPVALHAATASGGSCGSDDPSSPHLLRRQSGSVSHHGPAGAQGGLELIFRPDPTVWDGRFANNGWLQELPKPLTKVTWDATAWISPQLARDRNLEDGDVVELRYRGNTARMPIVRVPGHPQQSVTVFFGYGRTRAGNVGNATKDAEAFNAFLLRTSDAPWFGSGLEIAKTGERYPLAMTQEHHVMEGRAPVRVATIEEYKKKPEDHRRARAKRRSKRSRCIPITSTTGYKWGMAIDIASCTGCSACTIACVAENNIPVVGKDQVASGREMHWIRVDHYFAGDQFDDNSVEAYHQPVPCMQCENAPCELVCPVAATTHSAEGLNDMVYNRCVGTRYCSNNCPYKVRRFNFLLYQDWDTQSLYPMRNPDVTVRSRGVMEKCTYCVQRINQARIDAKREDRDDSRRRGADRVPAGVPVGGDRVRQSQRSQQQGLKAEAPGA